MRKLFIPSLMLSAALGLALAATPVEAQDISGGVDLKTSYVLGDFLYEAGPDPVVQAYANVAIGDTGCSAGAWGNVSLGEQVGEEIDLNGSCEFNIATDTTVTIAASRYLLLDGGVPDVTTVSAKVVHGPVDATVGVFFWDGGRPDGFAANVGYTGTVERFTIRPSLRYAHGLGDDDIVFVGVQVSRPLTSNLTVSVQGYLPIMQSDTDTRKGRIFGAISFTF